MVSDEYRKILIERYKKKMTYREMAQIHGCSYQNMSNTVSRIHSWMKKLWCSGLINGFESFISGCPVENVPISKRAWLPLRRSGIHTLGDLRIIGKEGLHNTRWVGAEIRKKYYPH